MLEFNYINGTLVNTADFIDIDVSGYAGLSLQIGTDIGTALDGQIDWFVSVNGTDFNTIYGCDLFLMDGNLYQQTSVTGSYSFNVAGMSTFRLIYTGTTTSIPISIKTSLASGIIQQIQATTYVAITGTVPLPTGAATEATLAALNAKFVSGTDIGDVTINNAAGAASVNIQDGGNSITVDGTFWQATQPISVASLPLPTGAATEATLSNIETSTDSIDFKLNQDYGASTDAIRTASQIGNTTGQADFNAGATGAQTLRVTANAGTNLNTSALNLEATQADIRTSVQLIDNAISGSEMQVDVVGALPAGTNNIGDVDVLTLPGVLGTKTNNNAAPGATNLGVLPALANAAAPSWTEGNLVALSVDLAGNQRVKNTSAGTVVPGTVATNSTLVGAQFNTTLPTLTTAQQAALQVDSRGRLIVAEDAEDSVLFKGRASTFNTPGRAGTTGQKILSLHNATGSAVTVKVTKITIDNVCTVVKAITVPPPMVRLWKVTVLPTNGTNLTKNKIGGTGATDAAITVKGDASADGTGSGTTLTATLPAGTILSQEYAPRFITAAGYEVADRLELLDGFITLAALEGVVIFLDYTVATQNPTTDRWLASIEWTET